MNTFQSILCKTGGTVLLQNLPVNHIADFVPELILQHNIQGSPDQDEVCVRSAVRSVSLPELAGFGDSSRLVSSVTVVQGSWRALYPANWKSRFPTFPI